MLAIIGFDKVSEFELEELWGVMTLGKPKFELRYLDGHKIAKVLVPKGTAEDDYRNLEGRMRCALVMEALSERLSILRCNTGQWTVILVKEVKD